MGKIMKFQISILALALLLITSIAQAGNSITTSAGSGTYDEMLEVQTMAMGGVATVNSATRPAGSWAVFCWAEADGTGENATFMGSASIDNDDWVRTPGTNDWTASWSFGTNDSTGLLPTCDGPKTTGENMKYWMIIAAFLTGLITTDLFAATAAEANAAKAAMDAQLDDAGEAEESSMAIVAAAQTQRTSANQGFGKRDAQWKGVGRC